MTYYVTSFTTFYKGGKISSKTNFIITEEPWPEADHPAYLGRFHGDENSGVVFGHGMFDSVEAARAEIMRWNEGLDPEKTRNRIRGAIETYTIKVPR